MNRIRPLLVSSDGELIDDVLRLAAANGVEVHLATDAEAARSRWALAPLVLVGADQAARVAAVRPMRRRDVVLVTREPQPEDWQRAVALGAEHVICLPDAERWLIDRIADTSEGAGRDGAVVAVMATGSGAGASTFAATLSLAAAMRSTRVLLVDGDPLGGGLDVLLGIEDADGIRWSDLADTRGRLSAITLDQALPHVGGVAVLSWGREGPEAVTPEAMSAVLDAGERGYDLVVVDLPRHLDAAADVACGRARETLLVAVNRVRATAAAARIANALSPRCASTGLVLRMDPKGVSDDAMLSALHLPVVGTIPTSSDLSARADEGEPPSLRDAYGKACAGVLRAVLTPLGQSA